MLSLLRLLNKGNKMLKSSFDTLNVLRVIAWVEGVTYILLFVTMPLKYLYDITEPNYLVGMLHGVFFLLYIALVLLVGKQDNWTFKNILLALVASLIPFGTFIAEKKLMRYNR